MTDVTDSPLFREAVEEVVDAWLEKHPHVPPTTLFDMAQVAYPYYRRLITEENAATLEGARWERLDTEAEGSQDFENGWLSAAAYLRGTR